MARTACCNDIVGTRTWSEDWEQRRAGGGCAKCAEGRPDEYEYGVRFFTGEVADGYLQRAGPLPGYSVVVWRGRHVAEPSEMAPEEAMAFWGEVLQAARAIRRVFEPCQLNYQFLANLDAHVHVHILPRYVDDASPNMPLNPWVSKPVPKRELAQQVKLLQAALDTP
jgi:diadenosine tetraphosphate (Ap4A) HIT family hydrolase